MSNDTETLAELIDKVRKLQEYQTLWQLIPEHLTDRATDAITVAEYLTYHQLGDMLRDYQAHKVVCDLNDVLTFVREVLQTA